MTKIKIEDLDKKLWKELKKNAGIKNSSWFKKADAAVGKHLSAVGKARDKFEKGGYLLEDLLKYQSALQDLDKVFDKFMDTKGLDDVDEGELKAKEKKELAAEIEDWKEQIDTLLQGLDKGIKTLMKAVGNDVKKLDSAEKGKRKQIMDKTFSELGF
jgi:hypothetical protein